MEPDKQNYWKDDSQPAEMYTPEPVNDDPEQLPPESQPMGGSQTTVPTEEPVHWSANEYISNKKGGFWYLGFALVVIALIAGDIFILKEFTFSILVVVMAAALMIYSHRPARILDYTLSGEQGLYVGEKLYHFSEFKAFGVISEEGHHSIMLIPIKRFALALSVYFPEDVGERIVDIFGARLPMRDLKLDAVDIIVRKLRI